jgi:hypothetical protein
MLINAWTVKVTFDLLDDLLEFPFSHTFLNNQISLLFSFQIVEPIKSQLVYYLGICFRINIFLVLELVPRNASKTILKEN